MNAFELSSSSKKCPVKMRGFSLVRRYDAHSSTRRSEKNRFLSNFQLRGFQTRQFLRIWEKNHVVTLGIYGISRKYVSSAIRHTNPVPFFALSIIPSVEHGGTKKWGKILRHVQTSSYGHNCTKYYPHANSKSHEEKFEKHQGETKGISGA